MDQIKNICTSNKVFVFLMILLLLLIIFNSSSQQENLRGGGGKNVTTVGLNGKCNNTTKCKYDLECYKGKCKKKQGAVCKKNECKLPYTCKQQINKLGTGVSTFKSL